MYLYMGRFSQLVLEVVTYHKIKVLTSICDSHQITVNFYFNIFIKKFSGHFRKKLVIFK